MENNMSKNRWKTSPTFIKEPSLSHGDFRQYGKEKTFLSQPVSQSTLYLQSKTSCPSRVVTMVRANYWGRNHRSFHIYLFTLFMLCLGVYMVSPYILHTCTKDGNSLSDKSEIAAVSPRFSVLASRSFAEIEKYIVALDESKGRSEDRGKVLQEVQNLKRILSNLGEEETGRIENTKKVITLLHQTMEAVNDVLERSMKT